MVCFNVKKVKKKIYTLVKTAYETVSIKKREEKKLTFLFLIEKFSHKDYSSRSLIGIYCFFSPTLRYAGRIIFPLYAISSSL